MSDIEDIKKSSRRSAILSILGLGIFIICFIYTSYSLYTNTRSLDETIHQLNKANDVLKRTNGKLLQEKLKVDSLKSDESQLNLYLLNLLNTTQKSQGNIKAQDKEVNWVK